CYDVRRALHSVPTRRSSDLGHDEGTRTHDGGQDLTARGSGRLDRAGAVAGIADLLHQRDGEGTGGDHVAGRRAVDGAHQGAGEDGHLRRATAQTAGDGEGEVDEVATHL